MPQPIVLLQLLAVKQHARMHVVHGRNHAHGCTRGELRQRLLLGRAAQAGRVQAVQDDVHVPPIVHLLCHA